MSTLADTMAVAQRVADGVPKGLFIGGEWREAASDATLIVDDPGTGRKIAEVADAGVEDAQAALSAAADRQQSWSATPPRERGELLRRAFEEINRRKEELAQLMTLEMGKPVAESLTEVAYAAEFFRWFSEEAVRIDGGYMIAPGGGSRVVVTRQPVGPSLLVTPWNFPMAMGTRKIGPALAAGCTVIIKPARQTPLSLLALVEILQQVGLPPGVVNVITTSTSGTVTAAILRDPRLRKLSFTGSTEVGRALLAKCADQVLRTSMELGGNAPFIIFDDADLDLALEGAVQAKMRNIGEACTAANRFYVQRGVAREFSEALAARLGSLTLGHGLDPRTQVGPLIDLDALTNVARLVEEAQDAGAEVLTGGEVVASEGHFYKPTVLSEVRPDTRIIREEIFGPVAPIIAFDDEDHAVTMGNNTPYGLAAYVFTQDLERGLRVSERLETGMVGLNQGVISNPAAPFGGIKESGLGREGGRVGIDEYLEVKYMCVRAPW
jgi:NAD-dependent aldehyde dehydrogenases